MTNKHIELPALRTIAHTAGDEASRHIAWEKDVAAFDLPIGTELVLREEALAAIAAQQRGLAEQAVPATEPPANTTIKRNEWGALSTEAQTLMREGCNYIASPNTVCRKCGHVHAAPVAQPATEPVAPPEREAMAMMYLQLTDAMGYDSGKDGTEFSPEEWAEALLRDALAHRSATTPAPAGQTDIVAWRWRIHTDDSLAGKPNVRRWVLTEEEPLNRDNWLEVEPLTRAARGDEVNQK